MDFWTDDRVEAYLTGVEDPTEMIVLDLFSEAAPQWNRTQSYYSKKWIWCLLHGTYSLSLRVVPLSLRVVFLVSFRSWILGAHLTVDYGGNMGLEGNLQDLTTQPLYALKNTVSMAGMGLAMEGQEGNEVPPPSPSPLLPFSCALFVGLSACMDGG